MSDKDPAKYRLVSKERPIPRIDFGPLPPGLDRRGEAEEETARDLTKEYEQLLADAHEEITDPARTPDQNLGFSNRRLGGIFARAAMAMEQSATESTRLNQSIQRMTKVILIFTIIAGLAACAQVFFAWKASPATQTQKE